MRSVKAKVILLLLLLVSTLLLSGYTIRDSSTMVEMEVFEDYDSEYSTYNTIKLDGEFITLPCEVSVLNKLGFDFKVNEEIEPRSMDNMNYMYNKSGDRISVDLLNLKESTVTFNDCVVVEISYDDQDGSTIGFEINGIKLGSTIEECEEVLGRPVYVSDSYDGIYTANFKSPKNERTLMLSFYNRDNTLMAFSVEVGRPLDLDVNGYHADTKQSDNIDVDKYPVQRKNNGVAFGMLFVFITVLLLIIFVIVLVINGKHKRENERAIAEARRDAEARRLIETPIEDIISNDEDLKRQWLNKS